MTDHIVKRLRFERLGVGLGALNPHLGEEGLCGREEIGIIEPAMSADRDRGIEVTDIHPAETLRPKFP